MLQKGEKWGSEQQYRRQRKRAKREAKDGCKKEGKEDKNRVVKDKEEEG